jgi:hypothetical protein
MNWSSNGFLGAYSDFLEKGKPVKTESKAEALKQLRIERYEQREARAKALTAAKPPKDGD